MTSKDVGLDWDVISIPEVDQIVQAVATYLAPRFQGYLEREDIAQEGYIILACRGPWVRRNVEENHLNYIANELRQDLLNKLEREHRAFSVLDFDAEATSPNLTAW